jgi:hypothetical protein
MRIPFSKKFPLLVVVSWIAICRQIVYDESSVGEMCRNVIHHFADVFGGVSALRCDYVQGQTIIFPIERLSIDHEGIVCIFAREL